MHCNDTSCKDIMLHFKYSNPDRSAFSDKAALWAGYLKEIVTPEYSIPGHMARYSSSMRWLGIAKTIFWTGASILIGLGLATLCN